MLIQGDTRNYSKENQECAGNTKVFFIVKEVKNIGFLTMDCSNIVNFFRKLIWHYFEMTQCHNVNIKLSD